MIVVNVYECCDPKLGYLFFKFGLFVPKQLPLKPTTPTKFKKRNYFMSVTMENDQQVEVTIEPKDASGNPAVVDGIPTWLTDNTDILTLEPAQDGMSCLVKATGMIGVANVQALADADLGAGVIELAGTLDFEITSSQATTIDLVPGEPEDQPPPRVDNTLPTPPPVINPLSTAQPKGKQKP